MTGPGSLYDLFDKPQDGPSGPAQPPPEGEGTPYGLRALEGECGRVRGAVEGTRNDTLNQAAFNVGQLVHAGHLDGDTARLRLADAAAAAGLPRAEADRTIASGFRGGHAKPRAEVPAPGQWPEPDVADVDDATTGGGATSFWSARPVLAHVHASAMARMVAPWAVLGAVLVRVLTLAPPHIRLPPITGGHGSLNLFCALVGPSGSGKGAAAAVAAECFSWPHHIVRAPLGSGEGILRQYAEWDSKQREQVPVRDTMQVLFTADEIDSVAAIGNRQGSTLHSQLRQAFSGESLGYAYASRDTRIILPAHSYRMCLLAGVQPERARALLDEAAGGTPQRFIWLPSVEASITADVDPAPPPRPLPPPRWSDATRDGWGLIALPDQVVREVREARAAQARGETVALDGHAMYARLKVAAAFALLEGRLAVTGEDWGLSGAVMETSTRTRDWAEAVLRRESERESERRAVSEARRAVASDEAVADARARRVARFVAKRVRREGRVGHGALSRMIASRDRGVFAEAVERLVESGQIEIDDSGNGAVYVWVEEGA